jgi:long-chain fatty acid transport protein
VPQLYFTHTLTNLPVSFGLGVYSPFGLGVEWPQNTGFRTVAISSDLKYVTINPVVALKLGPTFSIAGGLTVNYAELEMKQGLREFYTTPNSFRFSGDGWSAGYNLGALWQPHEKITFGATFRSASTTTFDGHTDIEQYPVIPSTKLPAQADFKFPLNAVVGLSYRPTPKWNFEFDADYTDWSSFGTINIQQSGKPPFPVKQSVPITLDWQPSWAYKFGATRYFENDWHVSAGYVFNQNSVPDDHYTPLVADMDRHFFSLGVGRKGRRFDFDVAYQFGYGATHTVTGSTPSSQTGVIAGENADGKYNFISHALLVSAGVHF